MSVFIQHFLNKIINKLYGRLKKARYLKKLEGKREKEKVGGGGGGG